MLIFWLCLLKRGNLCLEVIVDWYKQPVGEALVKQTDGLSPEGGFEVCLGPYRMYTREPGTKGIRLFSGCPATSRAAATAAPEDMPRRITSFPAGSLKNHFL
ncbi:MAG: hypothetical protein ACMUIM_10830 [bacterium]